LSTSPFIISLSGSGLLACLTKPAAEAVPTFGQRNAMRMKLFQFQRFDFRGIWEGEVRK